MKKKGFTLIELLAVIVILAIIALIAIPLIGNVIEKAKIGALENSVNGLVESANMYYANQSIKGEQSTETVFDFANGEQTSTEKLSYKGKVYNGKLILHANGEVAVCIDDKEHYAYKNKDTDEIVSGIGTCLYDGTTGDFSSNSPVEDLKKQIAAATATSDKVLEGSTIYTLSGLVAGTMANKSGQTVIANTITESEDGENTLISIPQAGYYDINSKISVSNSNLSENIEYLIKDGVIVNNSIDLYYRSTQENGYVLIPVRTSADGTAYPCITSNNLINLSNYKYIVIETNCTGWKYLYATSSKNKYFDSISEDEYLSLTAQDKQVYNRRIMARVLPDGQKYLIFGVNIKSDSTDGNVRVYNMYLVK